MFSVSGCFSWFWFWLCPHPAEHVQWDLPQTLPLSCRFPFAFPLMSSASLVLTAPLTFVSVVCVFGVFHSLCAPPAHQWYLDWCSTWWEECVHAEFVEDEQKWFYNQLKKRHSTDTLTTEPYEQQWWCIKLYICRATESLSWFADCIMALLLMEISNWTSHMQRLWPQAILYRWLATAIMQRLQSPALQYRWLMLDSLA